VRATRTDRRTGGKVGGLFLPAGMRDKGDYGGSEHVLKSNTEEAIHAAERILKAVHEAHPYVFHKKQC